MSNLSSLSERLQGALRPTDQGVLGLVDRLLELCRDQGLQLDWGTGRCRAMPLGAAPVEATEIQLPKSVFRAVLARVAALCNEHNPGAVSPYGGESCVVLSGSSPPVAVQVAFVNTSAEQRLELRPVREEAPTAAEEKPREEPSHARVWTPEHRT